MQCLRWEFHRQALICNLCFSRESWTVPKSMKSKLQWLRSFGWFEPSKFFSILVHCCTMSLCSRVLRLMLVIREIKMSMIGWFAPSKFFWTQWNPNSNGRDRLVELQSPSLTRKSILVESELWKMFSLALPERRFGWFTTCISICICSVFVFVFVFVFAFTFAFVLVLSITCSSVCKLYVYRISSKVIWLNVCWSWIVKCNDYGFKLLALQGISVMVFFWVHHLNELYWFIWLHFFVLPPHFYSDICQTARSIERSIFFLLKLIGCQIVGNGDSIWKVQHLAKFK